MINDLIDDMSQEEATRFEQTMAKKTRGLLNLRCPRQQMFVQAIVLGIGVNQALLAMERQPDAKDN